MEKILICIFVRMKTLIMIMNKSAFIYSMLNIRYNYIMLWGVIDLKQINNIESDFFRLYELKIKLSINDSLLYIYLFFNNAMIFKVFFLNIYHNNSIHLIVTILIIYFHQKTPLHFQKYFLFLKMKYLSIIPIKFLYLSLY